MYRLKYEYRPKENSGEEEFRVVQTDGGQGFIGMMARKKRLNPEVLAFAALANEMLCDLIRQHHNIEGLSAIASMTEPGRSRDALSNSLVDHFRHMYWEA